MTKESIDRYNSQVNDGSGHGRILMTIVEAREFLMALLFKRGDTEPPTVIPISKWLFEWSGKEKGTGALCATCDYEFQFEFPKGNPLDAPQKYLLTYPAGVGADLDRPDVATVSGICPQCCRNTDAGTMLRASQMLTGDKSVTMTPA